MDQTKGKVIFMGKTKHFIIVICLVMVGSLVGLTTLTARSDDSLYATLVSDITMRGYDYQPDTVFLESTVKPIDGSINVCNDETKSYRIDLTNDDDHHVYGMTNGNVVEIGSDETIGNYVIETTRDGYTIIYSFLDEIYVQVNDTITMDTYFATMGTSGQATGEPKVGITLIDPEGYYVPLSNYFE